MSSASSMKRCALLLICTLLNACDSGVTITLSDDHTNGPPAPSKEVRVLLAENSDEAVYSYSITHPDRAVSLVGVDADFFQISSVNGVISPASALDYETPRDGDRNNIYEFEIHSTLESEGSYSREVKVIVELEDLPVFEESHTSINEESRSLTLNWLLGDATPNISHYRVSIDSDGASGFSAVDVNRDGVTDSADLLAQSSLQVTLLSAPLKHSLLLRKYIIEALNSSGSVIATSPIASPYALSVDTLVQYIKSSEADSLDWFGLNVAINATGTVLAVGASQEGGSGLLANPDINNDSPSSGAVYIYRHTGERWILSDYLKASNTGPGDRFGRGLDLSDDGNVLAVGAFKEDGSGTGVNPASDNTSADAGAVYVYRHENGEWQHPVYIKPHNSSAQSLFGFSLALNGSGDVLAVGARREDGDGIGVNPTSAGSASNSGALYIFRRVGAVWTETDYIKSSNSEAGDEFGLKVALNGAGDVLVATALLEDGSGTGINPSDDNSAPSSGAAYVYRHDGNSWLEPTYIKANNAQAADEFGISASLDTAGDTLLISARLEDGGGAGVNPTSDELVENSGAVYIYEYDGSNWQEPLYLKASNPGANDSFGRSVSLSGDGLSIAAGARDEDGDGTGLNSDDNDNTPDAGAAYIFHNRSGFWQPPLYIKASNTLGDEQFGVSLDWSRDGQSLAVGASFEDGAGTGVNPITDKSLNRAGAAYIY